MTRHLAVVQGGRVSDKHTESFLMSQPDVLDASVWMNDERLMAHVTLAEGSQWTEKTLKVACAKALGLEHTPSEFLLFGTRLRVA